MYHTAMTPKLSWVYMDPIAAPVLVVALLLCYAHLVLGVEGILDVIYNSPAAYDLIEDYVGSAEQFASFVAPAFYITLVAHGLEALFVAQHASKTFRLHTGAVLEWCVFTLFCGLPILNRFLRYLEIQQSMIKKKET